MLFLLISGCGSEAPPPDEQPAAEPARQVSQPVVVYSSVSAAQMGPTLEAFTADTGIKVRLVSDDYPRLAAKLENHGGDPVADLLVGDSLASLSHAAENDWLRPTYPDSGPLSASGPLYDPDKAWYPLGVTARPIIYNTGLVEKAELDAISDYESLQDPIWQGRLCLSSSREPGNRLLIASLIAKHGERDAEQIVRGWRRNMTEDFYRDDTALLQAVSSGACVIAIADISVLAAFTGAGRNAPLAPHRLPAGTKVQIDISGAAVMRHARNPAGATDLLQWLSEETPNALYASSGYEFPVNETAPEISLLTAWSEFVADPMEMAELGFLQEGAVKLAERAHYP